MNPTFGTVLLAAALVVPASGAIANDRLSESRSVDARIAKVKLDGVISLQVKQGATPSLMLYGEKGQIDKVRLVQKGDTLSIDTDNPGFQFFGFSRNAVRAELTLPALNEFSTHGIGAAELNGFSGSDIKLSLDGTGSLTVTGNYKNVVARLGGVGAMTLNSGDSDKISLNLHGTGRIAINGQSKLLHADMSGVGGLDAKSLHADMVELDMSGVGSASVFASNSADLHLSGLGSAKVYGKPAHRIADARGLGKVSWD